MKNSLQREAQVAAVVWVQSLAHELLHAMGTAKKKKNSLEGSKADLSRPEERISETEDKTIEISRPNEQEEKHTGER